MNPVNRFSTNGSKTLRGGFVCQESMSIRYSSWFYFGVSRKSFIL